MPIRISGSTGISGLDGSATTPVLQGASANSGIYYSGNTVFVSTSSTNALTIGPTGNVAFANTNVSIGGQTISAYSGMMKNRIINGDMRIDQRFNGAANNNIAGAQYVVDRWYTNGTGAGKLRFQQNNTNGPGQVATQTATGFSNYFGCNVVSSNTVNTNDFWFVAQLVEGLNFADLGWGTANASPVTLSFWTYSSIAGTHGGSIQGAGGSRAFPFTYSISSANTWEQKVITVPGDTTGTWYSNNNVGISLYFDLGVGATYSSSAINNAWVTAASGKNWPTNVVDVVSSANGSFYLTGVQLEKGSQATAFDFRHYTTELSLCQRYCYIIPTNNYYLTTIQAWSTTRAQGYIPFPVTMRTGANLVNPSSLSGATCYGPTGTAINISTFALAVPVAAQNPTAAFIDVTVASGLTAGYAVMLYTTPTAGPTIFSAELAIQN